MRYPRPAILDDRSAWPVKDAAWTAQRKEFWKALYPALKQDLHVTPGEVKTLEKYLLTGTNPNPVKWSGHELPTVPLFFRLWFHADQSEENWAQQLAATCWTDYDKSDYFARLVCSSLGPGLGGLERRIYDALFGGAPTRTFLAFEWDFDEPKGMFAQEKPIHRIGGPEHVRDFAAMLEYPHPIRSELVRYDVGRWLTEHTHEKWAWVFQDEGLERLTRLFDLVRWFASAEGQPEAAPGHVELARELYALFERGTAPPRFQELWAEHGRSDSWKQTRVQSHG